MNIKRCLVTGASGFIGRTLCLRLQEQGVWVRALLRKTQYGSWNDAILYDFHDTGKRLPSQLMENIDTVFHLAGIAHTDQKQISKSTYWKVNVEATEQLMQMAADQKISRFIYFSSVKAVNGTDDYSLSKQAAENAVLTLGQKYGLHIVILRLALVYGPGVKGNLLNMLKGVDKGWFPPVPEMGNQRSLISVEDVVNAAFTVAENPIANGKIYTITDGHSYSTRQLYDGMRDALGLKRVQWSIPAVVFKIVAKTSDLIGQIMTRQLPLNSDSLEKLLGSAWYSSYQIEREIGWCPKMNFFKALPEIVKEYRTHNALLLN